MSTFKPRVQRIAVPRGGRIDSAKLSAFTDQVVDDLLSAGETVTELTNAQKEYAIVAQAIGRDLRQRVEQLAKEIEAMRTQSAEDNLELVYNISMHDSNKFEFFTGSTHATRVMVDTLFGEATVPINAAEHRFFQQAVNTGKVIPIEDLAITVTGTFDAGDGDGVTNHETGATITAGEPRNAFNGNNVSRWIRKVSFPMYDDTSEVMCEITIDIPAGSGGESNVLYVVPFPLGDVDVVGVYTSPDLSSSFSLITGFTEQLGAGPKRWIIPVTQVQRVKLRLRQRNWIEEDGRKVFYYGAQEIGLQLLEWDKTYDSGNPLNLNHTVVLKQDAPDGYAFNRLTSLNTDPLYTLEDPGSRHIHVKVATDAAGTDVIWDSDLDARPQDTTGFVPSSPVETLYFLVTMNYVASSGGSSSPFPVGTTPILRNLSFQAKVEAV